MNCECINELTWYEWELLIDKIRWKLWRFGIEDKQPSSKGSAQASVVDCKTVPL